MGKVCLKMKQTERRTTKHRLKRVKYLMTVIQHWIKPHLKLVHPKSFQITLTKKFPVGLGHLGIKFVICRKSVIINIWIKSFKARSTFSCLFIIRHKWPLNYMWIRLWLKYLKIYTMSIWRWRSKYNAIKVQKYLKS